MLFYDASIWKDFDHIVLANISAVPSFTNFSIFVNSWVLGIRLHLLFPLIEIRLRELKVENWLFNFLLDFVFNFLLSCFNLFHIKSPLIISNRLLFFWILSFPMDFPQHSFIFLKFFLKGSQEFLLLLVLLFEFAKFVELIFFWRYIWLKLFKLLHIKSRHFWKITIWHFISFLSINNDWNWLFCLLCWSPLKILLRSHITWYHLPLHKRLYLPLIHASPLLHAHISLVTLISLEIHRQHTESWGWTQK